MNTTIKDYVWRAETIRRINLLLDVAKSKKKMTTSDFFKLIDFAEVLEHVNSKAIDVIDDYNFIEGYDAFLHLIKLGDNFDKIRKFIGQAKTCNIYYLENEELKNVDRKLFIEVAEKMVDVISREMMLCQSDFEKQVNIEN